jgi:hypothetical protein
MTWYWTDDLARLLTESGRDCEKGTRRWISEPVAVRGQGEAIAVAEALLSEEGDESHLAA